MREIREIRIEDWNGNVYIPTTKTSSSHNSNTDNQNYDNIGDNNLNIAPTLLTRNINESFPNTNFTHAVNIAESWASTGNALSMSPTNKVSGKKYIAVSHIYKKIPFGNYSFSIRFKDINSAKSEDILKISFYKIDNSEVTTFSPNMSGATIIGEAIIKGLELNRDYREVFMGINYNNTYSENRALWVLIENVATRATLYIDHYNLSKSSTAMTGTVVKGNVVIY